MCNVTLTDLQSPSDTNLLILEHGAHGENLSELVEGGVELLMLQAVEALGQEQQQPERRDHLSDRDRAQAVRLEAGGCKLASARIHQLGH